MDRISKRLTQFASPFLRNEDGEVTIAWLVLTASLVSLSIVVMTSIGGSAEEVANETQGQLEETELKSDY